MSVRTVADIVFSQGFGSRRECAALIAAGRVAVGGRVLDDPAELLATDGLTIDVDAVAWPYQARALIALHKPAGYECSQRPKHHPSVLSLLPAPLRTRGVQPVGRLDADTTGLLLLTDDGPLLHRLTSPRHHVPKVYRAECAESPTDAQVAQLMAGVVLRDDPVPVAATRAIRSGTHGIELTLTAGKYHQVRRMLAAVGNHVVSLQRVQFGALVLPPTLAPGAWFWVQPAQLQG